MTPEGRQQLTQLLARLTGELAADLQQKMLAPGRVQDRARRLHAEELVGDDYAVWTNLLSRRAAVLWILKSVYVRVLEDRGLLSPKRIVDFESQQLFEDRIAPSLAETAYLTWVYRDLAHALPELFSVQPAEVARPADALSRKLLELWRSQDPDTGLLRHRFDEEHFDGQLMGDLYQDLDPVVKDRFSLLQTPAFVRDYILDHTLTPAITEWGADKVRVLDPACGSGHFLLGAFRRLVEATAPLHPEWSRPQLVQQVLDRVVGIDINDYACALARARLVMTALEACESTDLATGGQFHPQVYWADALEQVEREPVKQPQQLTLPVGEAPVPEAARRAVMTRTEVRAALKPILKDRFHVVVANPPFRVEVDDEKKKYHRASVSGRRRYVSAYREYSLASPFTERCFQVAQEEGYIGLITSNNFLKREFGKPLIEKVLAGQDLFKVVDTQGVRIPGHGTPTVILFVRQRMPSAENVLVVMGKRGEPPSSSDPATRPLWRQIVQSGNQVGFESEFISVAEISRETLGKHPWSLGGGGAAELKTRLDATCPLVLGEAISDIGRTTHTGLDPVYFLPPHCAKRIAAEQRIVWVVRGEDVRDYTINPQDSCLFPYDQSSGEQLPPLAASEIAYYWRYRRTLKDRSDYGERIEQRGLKWFEHSMFFPDRFRTPLSIAFAEVATHNQLALDRGGKVFNRTAPIIKLSATASEDDHLALLGILSSSTIGFWLRQVSHVKGGESTGTKIQSEVWSRRLEFDSTKIKKAPISTKRRAEVIELSRSLDRLAHDKSATQPSEVLEGSDWKPADLAGALRKARTRNESIRKQMVALQEELDWVVYVAYDLADDELPVCTNPNTVEPLAPEHRPFEVLLGQRVAAGEAPDYWFQALKRQPATELPAGYNHETVARVQARLRAIAESPTLALLEQPEYKRKWEPLDYDKATMDAAWEWLSDRIEAEAEKKTSPWTIRELAGALQDDARFLAVAELQEGRRDVFLEDLVGRIVTEQAVPAHPFHIYAATGLTKHAAWEKTWQLQRQEDAGEAVGEISVPPKYSQGSRGKTKDFLRNEYWRLRGELDVPKERFIAFTEVPGHSGIETLYGWAGWTPRQRARALLSVDESLEDQGVPLDERIGLLDTAWRLLPDVAREDPQAASQLKAELQALVGESGPSPQQLAAWKESCPPPRAQRASRGRPRAETRPDTDEDEA